jgi:hypothetical protein
MIGPSENDSKLKLEITDEDLVKGKSETNRGQELPTDIPEEDEYIFEADLDSGFNDLEDMPEDGYRRTEPHIDGEGEISGGERPTKHLSFIQRAQHIFFELKKKLGLVKKSKLPPEPDSELEEPPELDSFGQDKPEAYDNFSDSEPKSTNEIETLAAEGVGTIEVVDGEISASKEPLEKKGPAKKIKEIPIKLKEVKDSIVSVEPKPLLGQHEQLRAKQAEPPKHIKTSESTPKSRHERLMDIIHDKDILFIVTCLDDEFDIENTFVLLELAKSEDLLTIVISSLPRYFGKVENVYAMNKTLQKLRLTAEVVILIPYFESIKLNLITDLIKELIELITEPGLINLDVADLKIVVKGGNVGVITFGSGRHAKRAKDAFFDTLDSRLLNIELPGVRKALLNVTGSKDMTLGEVEGIAEQFKRRLHPKARLILGARINTEMTDSIKLFLLLGVTPMQVLVNRYSTE